MSDFTPKTRLEKILCGVVTTAKTRLEKAVKYAVDHAGGGGDNAPFEVNATRSVDSETQKETISFDTTAEDLYGAVADGKPVLAKTSITDDEATITIDTVLSVTAKKILIPDETPGVASETYEFHFVDMDKDEGAELYCAPELSGDDYVVFSRIAGN